MFCLVGHSVNKIPLAHVKINVKYGLWYVKKGVAVSFEAHPRRHLFIISTSIGTISLIAPLFLWQDFLRCSHGISRARELKNAPSLL